MVNRIYLSCLFQFYIDNPRPVEFFVTIFSLFEAGSENVYIYEKKLPPRLMCFV